MVFKATANNTDTTADNSKVKMERENVSQYHIEGGVLCRHRSFCFTSLPHK